MQFKKNNLYIGRKVLLIMIPLLNRQIKPNKTFSVRGRVLDSVILVEFYLVIDFIKCFV